MTGESSFCIQCDKSSLENGRRSVEHLRKIGYRGLIHFIGPSPVETTVGYRLEDVSNCNSWLLGLKLVVSGLSCKNCIWIKPGYLISQLPLKIPDSISMDPVHFNYTILKNGLDGILAKEIQRGYRCRKVLLADDDAWLIRPAVASLFVELVLEISGFLSDEVRGRRDVLMGYASSMLCGDPMAHFGVKLW